MREGPGVWYGMVGCVEMSMGDVPLGSSEC